jgi:hypothetical protein
MTQTVPRPRRSRRRTLATGLPHLAARLPRDFRSASAINSFIGDLIVEVTAGRADARSAAILGYLLQLIIQTLPLVQREGWSTEPARATAAKAAILAAFETPAPGSPAL